MRIKDKAIIQFYFCKSSDSSDKSGTRRTEKARSEQEITIKAKPKHTHTFARDWARIKMTLKWQLIYLLRRFVYFAQWIWRLIVSSVDNIKFQMTSQIKWRSVFTRPLKSFGKIFIAHVIAHSVSEWWLNFPFDATYTHIHARSPTQAPKFISNECVNVNWSGFHTQINSNWQTWDVSSLDDDLFSLGQNN